MMTLATLVITVFTALLWKINNRLAWLTGALESHSEIMLKLEARKADIPMVWWDSTIDPFPFNGEHGNECKLEKIYIGMPLKYRRHPRTFCYQIGSLYRAVRHWRHYLEQCKDDFTEMPREDQSE